MTSSIDRLEAAFGQAAQPELVVAVQQASDASIADLAERLLAEPPAAAAAPANELWPVISARLGVVSTPRGPVGAPSRAFVDVLSASDPRFSGSGLFSNGVLRALLYCHGLVLEDPLLLAADMYAEAAAEHRPAARKFLEAATLSLVELAPLLRAGVVETFFASEDTRAWADQTSAELGPALAAETNAAELVRAFESLYVEGLHPKLQQLWRVVRRGDEPSDELLEEAIGSEQIEIAEAFIEIAQDLPPTAVAETVFDAVAHSLAAVRQLGGVHDLLLPPGLFEVLLRTAQPHGVEWRRLRSLSNIDVPGIDDLQVEDAIAIRQTSEAFALWRSRLSVALDRVRAIAEEEGSYADGALVVAETLADARAALLEERSSSAVLSSLRGGINFAAGAIGAAVGGLSGGASGAALGAAGATVTSILSAAFLPLARTPGFIRRHYVAFDRRGDGG